jgi:hypothetical protein
LGNPDTLGIFKNLDVAIMEVKHSSVVYDQAWSPNAFIDTGDWRHIAVVWGRVGTVTYFKICLDGNCKAQYDGSTSDFNPNLAGNFCVGWTGYYGYSISIIDELKIFDYTKTNSEINEDYLEYKQNNTKKECVMYKPQSKGPVKVNCSGLYVNNEPFLVKGLGYQPIPIGMTAKSIPDKQFIYNDKRIRERDFPLLRAMGANTIRTWYQVLNKSFMDDLYNDGVDPIYVLMGFWINCSVDYSNPVVRQSFIDDFAAYVNEYKDHPAVLAWMLGNENNLGYCLGSSSLADFYSLTNELARVAYELEGENYHPVAVINGDLGGIGNPLYNGDDEEGLNYTDFWGINAYRGKSFGTLFEDYASLTGKPMVVTEYGTDALNNSNHQEMQETQVDWNIAQWREIANNTLGGTIMEYSDEWWKGADFGWCGTDWTHDFSCGHGDFPTPDGWSNEEWFGVMRTVPNPEPSGADLMEPRLLYYALQQEWTRGLSFNHTLNQGWNLISIPLDPGTSSLPLVLSSIEGNYEKILAYQNGSWVELGAGDDIYPQMGFWVYMTQGDTLLTSGYEVPPGSVHVNPGWNLVGFPYPEEHNISEFPVKQWPILKYEGVWQTYIPNKAANSLTKLTPGNGYWVKND